MPSKSDPTSNPKIVAVSSSAEHTFSKPCRDSITLLAGLGVEGDAHLGKTVKHRSRVKADPTQPNLRQVHLIHSELLATLQAQGFNVAAGVMGENITTANLDLLNLPRGTRLQIGESAEVEVTGLRNPCTQLDQFQDGLMNAVLERTRDGNLIRKAGIMAIVRKSGEVKPNDAIQVLLPAPPHQKLERV